jgi:hypothetical protein
VREKEIIKIIPNMTSEIVEIIRWYLKKKIKNIKDPEVNATFGYVRE